MAKHKVSSVDLNTGEILPHVLVAMPQKVPNGFSEGWVAMAQSAAKLFAGIKSADDHRVLWMLLAQFDFENYIRIEQAEIAKELGMHRPNVSQSIKRLHELGVLSEGPKVGRSRTYKISPSYGWKGSSKNHQQALRTADKAKAAGLFVVNGGQPQSGNDKATSY
jgi:predicted transcriptional regulator